MKTSLSAKTSILAAVISAVLAGDTWAEATSPMIKEQPHHIYHVVKNKTLQETANQLANRSGITFKIDPAVEKDVINRKLAGDDWSAVLAQLLQGYNYTVVSDKGVVKTVVITGRNGSGQDNVPAPAENELVVVAPDFSKKIPARYKNFNAGSVMNVKLPMAELAKIPVGDDLVLDLPIGQYKVKHDNLVDHNDGSSTWIGYLDEEGKGYRVYLSQGDTGVMGNVYTPDGVYNIETVDGQTVVVNVDKSGLESAGYEHDQVEHAAAGMGLTDAAASMNDNLSNLKAAAESARANANARAVEAKALNDKYLKATEAAENAKNQVIQLNSVLSAAKAKYAAALGVLNKPPRNAASIAEFRAASTRLSAANFELRKAISANYLAVSNARILKSAYDKKAAEAKAAETNAKTAEGAYAAAVAKPGTTTATSTKSTPTPTPTPTTPKSTSATATGATVVDLMVLYTTTNQTADYAKQRIKYLVDVSNQAYKDSGINMSLRLVHTRATSYVENNDNSQALDDLTGDRGAFVGTAALRNQYGADLVALFRPLYAKTAGSCGTAYVGFVNGSGANPSSGYGVIGDGYSKDAASNSYCGTNTFAHEIGHNLGNVHDREYSNAEGKFPYSYAWGIGNKFGTIMSYYGPSVMLFSTPNLATQCAGTPCGFAEGDAKASDQVRTINYTAPSIAGYRSTTVSVPVIQ